MCCCPVNGKRDNLPDLPKDPSELFAAIELELSGKKVEEKYADSKWRGVSVGQLPGPDGPRFEPGDVEKRTQNGVEVLTDQGKEKLARVREAVVAPWDALNADYFDAARLLNARYETDVRCLQMAITLCVPFFICAPIVVIAGCYPGKQRQYSEFRDETMQKLVATHRQPFLDAGLSLAFRDAVAPFPFTEEKPCCGPCCGPGGTWRMDEKSYDIPYRGPALVFTLVDSDTPDSAI